ncbi:ASPM protein, partial [Pseudoatta argentina]
RPRHGASHNRLRTPFMSQTSKEDADAMKANTAATKIQANFRGYRVRKQLKESTQRRRQQQQNQQDQKRNQQQQQQQEHMKPKEHLLKRQSTQEALEEKSATKIQAGIRGFLVRKRQQAVQAAATRIQAGFRGFRTRKLLKQNGQ